MLGHSYECTKCDFEFCSGWSHHAGGQSIVCAQCGAHFLLGEGQSPWSPRDGETLQLMEHGSEQGADAPTGISTVVHYASPREGQEWDGIVRLLTEPLICPRCNGQEALIQEFDADARCPACRTGTIKRRSSIIY